MVYTVGEMAKLLDIPASTLRYYDKEGLLPFYGSFGFVNEGISGSVHGGVVWYQMRLTLNQETEENP